jgi:ubiquinone/menaquinone biosynthesis C-methylase UbiE
MGNPKPLVHWTPKLYDKIARYYDWMAHLFPIERKGHEKVLEGLVEGSILDIACGTGTLLAMANKRGLNCYGMDTSRGMLLQARNKVPEAVFCRASFYELPFSDETFDYVVETNAVSGVEIEVDRVLSEMIRVCKSGGEIRIADYARSNRSTKITQTLERILHLIGDFAYDYKTLFQRYGYVPIVEVLGWGGMYQYIKIER